MTKLQDTMDEISTLITNIAINPSQVFRHFIRIEQVPIPSPMQFFKFTQPMNYDKSDNASVKLSRNGFFAP